MAGRPSLRGRWGRGGFAVVRSGGVALLLGIVAAVAPAPAYAEDKPAAVADKPAQPPAAPAQREPQGGRIKDGVVAVVDGEPITLRELKRYGVTGAPFLPPEVRSDYRALLESMIEHKLLRAEFEKNGVTAPDAMVERYIANVLQESGQTRAQLEADIARVGLTWKDYFERMREEVQRIQLVNLLIRSRVNVPEEEVRRAWETDPEFLEGEKLEVAAIFVPGPTFGDGADKAKQEAEAVQKEARRNFESAAKKYSKGLNAEQGGHLGEFKRGTMAAQFEKGLKGLGEGDVSEPVDGPDGWYIVKLLDTKQSARKPFDEVKKELADKLYEKRLSERYAKWATEDLRKDHRIDYLIDDLALSAASE